MRLVWTPDPSGHVRGGPEDNLAQKCLAGMLWFLNPANFVLDLQCNWSGTTPIIKIPMFYHMFTSYHY